MTYLIVGVSLSVLALAILAVAAIRSKGRAWPALALAFVGFSLVVASIGQTQSTTLSSLIPVTGEVRGAVPPGPPPPPPTISPLSPSPYPFGPPWYPMLRRGWS